MVINIKDIVRTTTRILGHGSDNNLENTPRKTGARDPRIPNKMKQSDNTATPAFASGSHTSLTDSSADNHVQAKDTTFEEGEEPFEQECSNTVFVDASGPSQVQAALDNLTKTWKVAYEQAANANKLLETALTTARSWAGSLEQKLRDSEEYLKASRSVSDDLQAKLDTSNKDLADALASIRALEHDLVNSERNLQANKDECARLRTRVNAIDNHAANIDGLIDENEYRNRENEFYRQLQRLSEKLDRERRLRDSRQSRPGIPPWPAHR